MVDHLLLNMVRLKSFAPLSVAGDDRAEDPKLNDQRMKYARLMRSLDLFFEPRVKICWVAIFTWFDIQPDMKNGSSNPPAGFLKHGLGQAFLVATATWTFGSKFCLNLVGPGPSLVKINSALESSHWLENLPANPVEGCPLAWLHPLQCAVTAV